MLRFSVVFPYLKAEFYKRKSKETKDKKTDQLKAADFFAYQEISQQGVRDKIYVYDLNYEEVEEVPTNLIANWSINEERFARAYIR